MSAGLARLTLLLCGLVLLPEGGRAAEVPIGNGLYNVPLHTLIDFRFRNVVRQTRDLSCGAAAMATLLKYYYGEDLTDEQAIADMVKLGDSSKIMKDGFSMLELKRFGEARGYSAGGFRLADAASLKKLQLPAITLIPRRGYSHFVVIKGVIHDTVYIADPAYGNRSRRLDAFDPDWNHVILVFVSSTRRGNNEFAYDSVVKAPMRGTITILERSITPHTPGAGAF